MSKWTAPQDVDDITLAFSGNVIGTYLPPMADIPDEFKQTHNPWNEVASRWFAIGLKGRLIPKPGMDVKRAMRHLRTALTSFEPQHQHKEAGVAYLLSLWFDRYEE